MTVYKFGDEASKLLDFLYVGGLYQATDVIFLQELGITHIINCATGACQTGPDFYGQEFKYIGFSAQDDEEYDIMQHFDEVYSCIEDARKNEGKVFIHCSGGVNRSVTLAVAYIMVHKHMGPISAAMLAKEARGACLLNEHFQECLVSFACKKQLLNLDKQFLD